jgi:hypothetical protein
MSSSTAPTPTIGRDVLALVGLALATPSVVANALLLVNRALPVDQVWGARWTPGLWAVAFGAVGVVLAMRVRGNAIGWLLLLAGLLSGALYLSSEIGVHVDARGGVVPPAFAWYGTWSWIPTTALIATALIVFPDGRPASGSWRLLLVVLPLVAAAFTFTVMTGPELESFVGGQQPNPYAVAWLPVSEQAAEVANLAYQMVLLLAVLSLIARRRTADATTRHQLRWIALAAATLIGVLLLVEIPNGLGITTSSYRTGTIAVGALIATVPLAIGVAVLQYRLYDIDRLISRTVSYALVTAVLASVYIVAVLGAQMLVAGRTAERSQLIVAGSTLLVIALFQPVRRSARRLVDRRFNRQHLDASRTVEDFSGRLRDGVELESLATELRRTTVAAVQPASVGVWLPSSEAEPAE